MAAKPTVVYIASVGHSGSTLLDLLLSSHSQATGLGEIKNLSSRPRRRDRKTALDERTCDCGHAPRRGCPFWSGVEAALRRSSGIGLDDVDLELGSDDRFAAHNLAFYAAAAEASGKRFLVDSSKSRTRLYRLLRVPDLDVRTIRLTRDPRGLACSQARRGRPWWTTLWRWLLYEHQLGRRLRQHDALQVHYEELATKPEVVIPRIMSWLGLPFEPAQLDWTAHTHHLFAGNPHRRTRNGEIRLDDSWRRELGVIPRLAIPLLVRLASGLPRSG